MPLKIPPELKKITQYIRRAEEIENVKSIKGGRIIAYYCRRYAVQIGLDVLKTSGDNGPSGKECLKSLFDALDKEEKVISTFSKQECRMICREFAMSIFDKADQEDRFGEDDAGMNYNAIAKTFYSAGTFLDILKQFHSLDDIDPTEVEEENSKSHYAKWKATEILKALKEGRTPTRGNDIVTEESTEPIDENQGNSTQQSDYVPQSSVSSNSSLPPEKPSVSSTSSLPEKPIITPTVRQFSGDVPKVSDEKMKKITSLVSAGIQALKNKEVTLGLEKFRKALDLLGVEMETAKRSSSASRISNESISDAKELACFAYSALKHNDVENGIARLEQAISFLL